MESRPGQKEMRGKVVPALARMAIVATLAVGVACTDSTGPGARVSIKPEAPTVTLQSTPQGPTLNTSVILTNNSAQAVLWSPCGIALEKAGMPALPPGKSEWETVWSRICYLLENNPVALTSSFAGPPYIGMVLKPGESATIPVLATVGQSPYPNFTGEPGQYRFHLSLSTQFMGTYYPVPHEWSVSDSFTLLPAP